MRRPPSCSTGRAYLHADRADPDRAHHGARHRLSRRRRIEVAGGRRRHPGAGLLRDGARGLALGTIFVTRGASLAAVQNDSSSSVSHELRTPLTSIRLFIDTLREERITDAAEKQRCLAIIDQELGPPGRPGRQADRAVEDRVAARRLRARARSRWPHRRGRAGDVRGRCDLGADIAVDVQLDEGPGRARRPRRRWSRPSATC